MLKINDLAFGYTKRNDFFTHLTLELNQPGIYGLLGKNGSGKTTLLKIIAGLLFPKQGTCEIMGQRPALRQPDFLNKIYFLPEDLFVPALTAHDYVKFYAPFYPKFDFIFLNQCLKEFDLPQDKLLTTFSHGQKKKFLISFGLATQCQLLILDEPTNGLDIPSKSQFRKLVASAITDEKLFIISTHQVHDVENLIESVLILEEGNIIYNQRLNDHEEHIDLEVLFNSVLENNKGK